MEARDARKSDPISLSICSSSKARKQFPERVFHLALSCAGRFPRASYKGIAELAIFPLETPLSFLDHFNTSLIFFFPFPLLFVFSTLLFQFEFEFFSLKFMRNNKKGKVFPYCLADDFYRWIASSDGIECIASITIELLYSTRSESFFHWTPVNKLIPNRRIFLLNFSYSY